MPSTVDLTDNNCHIAGWRHGGDNDDYRQTIRRRKKWILTNGKQPLVCMCVCWRKCRKCALVCAFRASADSSQEICRPWTMQQQAECLLLSVTCQMTTETNQPTATRVKPRQWWRGPRSKCFLFYSAAVKTVRDEKPEVDNHQTFGRLFSTCLTCLNSVTYEAYYASMLITYIAWCPSWLLGQLYVSCP